MASAHLCLLGWFGGHDRGSLLCCLVNDVLFLLKLRYDVTGVEYSIDGKEQ